MCIAIYYIKFENQNYPEIIFTFSFYTYLFVNIRVITYLCDGNFV